MRSRSALAAVAVVGAVAATAVLAGGSGGGGAAPRTPASAAAAMGWSGLVGAPRAPVAVGQRVIVVLSAFSLADRVFRAGGLARDRDERRWTAAAFAAQQQFISDMREKGVRIKPDFRFTRTLNGFSARLDARAIALLERTRGVRAVYPVRIAYPASTSGRVLRGEAFARGLGHRPELGLGGMTGGGVTVALLDTGVDLRKSYLHGHVQDGIDVIDGRSDARARAKPTDPGLLERHGTEMAGLIVGSGGPGGIRGVAPGAAVLPIRVAGWQPDLRGDYTVYARTDQILAGLERAVDPNGDGDAHDAARIALLPVVEPFAAFADSPLARAAAGAARLDTLLIVPAGNDGAGGPSFGSVAGPAGAPDALTVGAVDARRVTQEVRVVARAGLSSFLDRVLPLAGAVAPSQTLRLEPAAPRGSGASAKDFFRRGLSLVAGRAAVVPAGGDPAVVARHAADAGAAAVLLYGRAIAPGGLGLDERVGVPVVLIPGRAARMLRTRPGAVVAIAAPRQVPAAAGRVAPFSSWGLAFDGGVKPELVASGVGLVTAEPGSTEDGSPAFGTVSGSSASAAVVAGGAALLAEARPEAGAKTLRALLIGSGDHLGADPPRAQGAGGIDLARAAAAEVVAEPATLSFGRGSGDGWQGVRVLRLRNVSVRRLTLFVATGQGRRPAVPLTLSASRVEIEPGNTARVAVRARLLGTVAAPAATGALTITPVGGVPIRVPWSVVLDPAAGLLGPLQISERSFRPSERKPAVLTFRAGRVARSPLGTSVVPVLRLDVELRTTGGKRLGLLARLRDLLPGRYSLGLTGRGPGGKVLDPGRYRIRLLAWPTGGGPPQPRSVEVTIRKP